MLGEGLTAHRLSVQADTSSGAVSLPLNPDAALGARHWRELAVALPQSARAIRVVVEQQGPWPALGGPRLTKIRPVTTVTDGQIVFADQLSAMLWPDIDHAEVAHGMTNPPTVRVSAAEHIDPGVLSNSTFTDWGGNFATSAQTATYVRMTSALPGGPETTPWGTVDRILCDSPLRQVDFEFRHHDPAGWTRLPTLAGEGYIGRKYTG